MNGHLTPGATGGEEQHILTVSEMPSHSHSGALSISLNGNNDSQGPYPVGGTFWQNQFTSSVSFSTNAVGGNQPHNIMPRFIALAYIMKL